MSEEKKETHQHQQHNESQPPQYGTFQGVANYSPQPAIGFPQPAPPPGMPGGPPQSLYDPRGYQTLPGYAVAEGRPVRERRLPCCGIGIGWFLFIIGFLIVGIPWYVAAVIMLCSRSMDPREKPGFVACTIGAVLETVVLVFGLTRR